MCTKSPGLAYCCRKFKTVSKSKLNSELEDSPLREKDLAFVKDIVSGCSYKELSEKYNKSISRISKWKRACCDQLLQYYIKKEEEKDNARRNLFKG